MSMSDIGEMIIPWQLQPSSLNTGESDELAMRRLKPMTITEKKVSEMNPIALASFGSKIGPWLGRTITVDAKFLPSLLDRLKTGAKFTGKSVGEITTWAKSNPANAVLLATTLASLGFSVSELFGSSKDPETQEFISGLNGVYAKASAYINSIGASSESAKSGSASEERQVQDEVAIEVLSWARGFFGSVTSAVDAHRMLQAYLEMPLNEVQHGFSVYKLR